MLHPLPALLLAAAAGDGHAAHTLPTKFEADRVFVMPQTASGGR